MEIGDFVKGKPNNGYGFTNEDMTRGVVTKVLSDGHIKVKILDHAAGSTGEFEVKADRFEITGHQKKFDRIEILELLQKGCKKSDSRLRPQWC